MALDLNLTKTAEALIEYDDFKARWDALLASGASLGKLYRHMAEEDRLAEAVGVAFGHDTADRNPMDTCRACVRPGDPWLRNLVAQWRAA